MNALPCLALAAALLAGCASPTSSQHALPRASLAANALAFGDAQTVSREGGGETSLAISPDGATWLACTHGGFVKPSPLFASLDAGATWKDVPVAGNPAPSGDCDVAILAGGAWAIAYNTPTTASVAVSKDRGASWSVDFVAGASAVGLDRPWLLAVGNALLLTYCNVMGVEPNVCFFARSQDDGATWSTPVPFATPAGGSDALGSVTGHLVASADARTILVPNALYDPYVPDPLVTFVVARSTDGGASWANVPVAAAVRAPPQFPTVALAADGTAWFAFEVSNGTTSEPWDAANAGATGDTRDDVRAAVSRDAGATWAKSALVAPGVAFTHQSNAWVDARPDGRATLAWQHKRTLAAGAFAAAEDEWRVDAALLDAGGAAIWQGNATRAWQAQQGVDYFEVRHDAAGRAVIVFNRADRACAGGGGTNAADCIMLAREQG